MLDAKAREALEGVSRFAGEVVAKTGVSPNVLTVAGVGITAIASWQAVSGRWFVAAAILSAGSAFDFLDGSVARVTGRTSTLGAFLDSVTDRLSDAIILSALVWVYVDRADRLGALAALLALATGQLVPYVRAKAESLGLRCDVGVIERAERILFLIAGLAVGQFVPVALTVALAALSALSVLTVVQRLFYVGRQAQTPS